MTCGVGRRGRVEGSEDGGVNGWVEAVRTVEEPEDDDGGTERRPELNAVLRPTKELAQSPCWRNLLIVRIAHHFGYL